jgi:hypothetical protein
MQKLYEGFSDFEKKEKPLIVKVNRDISSHPGVDQFMGNSRIDGRPLYKLNPRYFYGDLDLATQLDVESIELIQMIEDVIPSFSKNF